MVNFQFFASQTNGERLRCFAYLVKINICASTLSSSEKNGLRRDLLRATDVFCDEVFFRKVFRENPLFDSPFREFLNP